MHCLTLLPTNFSALKMFKLQHQFDNIVETTQLTMIRCQNFIDIIVNVHSVHHQLQAPTQSLQSLNLTSLSQPCQSVLMAGCNRKPEALP